MATSLYSWLPGASGDRAVRRYDHRITCDSCVLFSEQTALRVLIVFQKSQKAVFIYECIKDTVAPFFDLFYQYYLKP